VGETARDFSTRGEFFSLSLPVRARGRRRRWGYFRGGMVGAGAGGGGGVPL
jgi:hypothetical protein